MNAPARIAVVLLGLHLSGCGLRASDQRGPDAGVADRAALGPDAAAADAGSAADAATGPDLAPAVDAGGAVTVEVQVSRVIDGDTIILSDVAGQRAPDGEALDRQRVRFIGIDTPEISHDGSPSECFGDEAARFTRDRLEGRTVTLEYDFSTGLRDVYDRILAYVAIEDEVINETLLAEGYAKVFRRFSFRDRAAYLAIEASAERDGVGLWSACP